VLVSGDEDFVYAVNAVAYKGCRVEVAGFRSNSAPKLIDVADYFIDLGEIADKVRKEHSHGPRYYETHPHEDSHTHSFMPSVDEALLPDNNHHEPPPPRLTTVTTAITEIDITEDTEHFNSHTEFIRITDDH
jgi:hypothetical protein